MKGKKAMKTKTSITDEGKSKKLRKASVVAERSEEQYRRALKLKVKMFYDMQMLRLQTGGRVAPRDNQIQLHEVDIEILGHRARSLIVNEKEALKDVEAHLKGIPFYTDILNDKKRYRGIGPTMAGVLIGEVGFYQEWPSQMFSFCGLAVIPCFRCRKCQHIAKHDQLTGKALETAMAEVLLAQKTGARIIIPPGTFTHAVKKESHCGKLALTEADVFASGHKPSPQAGVKLPYNAWLRSKLCGVLGPSLIKSNSPWRYFYDTYKRRWQLAGKGTCDGHRHNAANRYMVKMLLLDIWTEWKKYHDQPLRQTWHQEFMGGHPSGETYKTPWELVQAKWGPYCKAVAGES